MLRADLHIHTRFSRDANASPEAIVARCMKVGLNCIAITDHDTIRGAQEVQRIAPFRVIIGEEVGTSAGELMGLFLGEEIPAGLSPQETARAIKEQGGLVSLPHPFDRLRSSALKHDSLEEILPLVDMVEVFNGHTFLSRDNRRARELAQAHGLPMAVGSDAHAAMELGRTYMEMPDFDGTPQGFAQALAQARLVTRRANPLLRFITTYVKLRRLF